MTDYNPFTHKPTAVPLTHAELSERQRQRENQGAARQGESCDQRNMRRGWGCRCHGATFCPSLEFVGYDDDVPVYRSRS